MIQRVTRLVSLTLEICKYLKICAQDAKGKNPFEPQKFPQWIRRENQNDKYSKVLPSKLDRLPFKLEKKRVTNGYFLHLTDLHFDPYYAVGIPLFLTLRLEQRRFVVNLCAAEQWKVRVELGNGIPKDLLTQRGNYQCDTPEILIKNMLSFFQGPLPEYPRFVLWTGGTMPHDIWMQSKEYVLSVLQNVSVMLNQTFNSRNIPVYPVLGMKTLL